MRVDKPILLVLLALALGAASFLPASAEDRLKIDASGRPVRVQVAISLFMPGSLSDANGEDSAAHEQARRLVYGMAAKECAVLQSVIANSCRLEALTVNVNRQPGRQPDGIFISGSISYSITLK
jgi:hypothetical protein